MGLQTKGRWFIDEDGRKVLLRGVNLGGSTKVPVRPDGATHLPTDFSDHRDVSFVGRPFPLKDAEEHFTRLQSWGFNCLRLLTTWEAIEHEGPGIYDTKYLDYIAKITEIAGDYGFYVFIDPHQDVWSRMTGGDGAPGWTFDQVGLDFQTFRDNGGAKVMQWHYPQNYEAMEWFMNYQRFSVATMFTLFFGSEDFAPNATVNGQSIQQYLQSHFIKSILEVAKRVKHFDHVIGFDSLNEPHPGFIGIEDIGAFPEISSPGLKFTPFDAIAAGAGYPRQAAYYDISWLRLKEMHQEMLNPEGISSWIGDDIWRQHGIYTEIDRKPVLQRPGHFKSRPDGTRVEFFHDYLRPFAIDYITQIREIMPDSLLFIEGDPQDPVLSWTDSDPQGVVNASHWYDGWTLYTKSYRSWFTVDTDSQRPVLFPGRVRDYYKRQLLKLVGESKKIGNVPTLIGEFGIPFDMNGKKAYHTGDFTSQIRALTEYYRVMDELQLHTTQWNYTADNNNEFGDLWNLEDLSIFSPDQQSNPGNVHSGGRAIEGFCRPYPQKISGTPIKWIFDLKSRNFRFDMIGDGGTTEIYIPSYHYDTSSIEISIDTVYEYDPTNQTLSLFTQEAEKVELRISG